MTSSDQRDARPPRRLGARTYIIGALIIFVIPGLGGGAAWWLYAQKAAVDRALTQPLREFEGHTNWVYSVAFSPDGRRALSGNGDGTLRLWNLETGTTVREFRGHTNEVRSVTFGPDGRRALSGSWDETFRLWDLETGQCLRTFTGHASGVLSVAFGPDGRRALSGSYDGTLCLWDLETGAEVRVFKGHTSTVRSVTFGPDGRRALSGSWDETLRLWDLATGQELARFVREGRKPGAVLSATFAPNGRVLAGGRTKEPGGKTEAEILLWRVPTDTELWAWRKLGGKFPEPPSPGRSAR